jgi:RNA polymerase sigma-B factor
MSSPSSRVTESWLLDRYQQHRDLGAREELVRRMGPLARRIAGAYNGHGHEEDMLQAAYLGLTKAIDRYDASFGVPLATYAIPTMTGEVRRYLRDRSWAVRLPRTLQEHTLAVSKCVTALTASEGRSPTPQRVADELSMSLEDVLEALQAGSAYRAASLDEPSGRDDDGTGRTLGDTLGVEDHGLDLAESVADLRGLFRVLDARERRVIAMRFDEDLTQSEIAERIGVSQMQVSRILRKALQRMHDAAGRAPDRSIAETAAA